MVVRKSWLTVVSSHDTGGFVRRRGTARITVVHSPPSRLSTPRGRFRRGPSTFRIPSLRRPSVPVERSRSEPNGEAEAPRPQIGTYATVFPRCSRWTRALTGGPIRWGLVGWPDRPRRRRTPGPGRRVLQVEAVGDGVRGDRVDARAGGPHRLGRRRRRLVAAAAVHQLEDRNVPAVVVAAEREPPVVADLGVGVVQRPCATKGVVGANEAGEFDHFSGLETSYAILLRYRVEWSRVPSSVASKSVTAQLLRKFKYSNLQNTRCDETDGAAAGTARLV